MVAIKSEIVSDEWDRTVVILRKNSGKLTVAEIKECLRLHHPGRYIIKLMAGEDNYDDYPVDSNGDEQDLYRIDEICPLCSRELLQGYCPQCGADLHEASIQ